MRDSPTWSEYQCVGSLSLSSFFPSELSREVSRFHWFILLNFEYFNVFQSAFRNVPAISGNPNMLVSETTYRSCTHVWIIFDISTSFCFAVPAQPDISCKGGKSFRCQRKPHCRLAKYWDGRSVNSSQWDGTAHSKVCIAVSFTSQLVSVAAVLSWTVWKRRDNWDGWNLRVSS